MSGSNPIRPGPARPRRPAYRRTAPGPNGANAKSRRDAPDQRNTLPPPHTAIGQPARTGSSSHWSTTPMSSSGGGRAGRTYPATSSGVPPAHTSQPGAAGSQTRPARPPPPSRSEDESLGRTRPADLAGDTATARPGPSAKLAQQHQHTAEQQPDRRAAGERHLHRRAAHQSGNSGRVRNQARGKAAAAYAMAGARRATAARLCPGRSRVQRGGPRGGYSPRSTRVMRRTAWRAGQVLPGPRESRRTCLMVRSGGPAHPRRASWSGTSRCTDRCEGDRTAA